MLSLGIVNAAGKSFPLSNLRVSILGEDPTLRSKDLWIGDMTSFYPTLAAVIIEGLIISASLFVICFLFALFLETQQNKDLEVDV